MKLVCWHHHICNKNQIIIGFIFFQEIDSFILQNRKNEHILMKWGWGTYGDRGGGD